MAVRAYSLRRPLALAVCRVRLYWPLPPMPVRALLRCSALEKKRAWPCDTLPSCELLGLVLEVSLKSFGVERIEQVRQLEVGPMTTRDVARMSHNLSRAVRPYLDRVLVAETLEFLAGGLRSSGLIWTQARSGAGGVDFL